MKKLAFQSKVVLWSGDAAWHFAYVDGKLAEKLREMPRTSKRGFGSIKVRAKIGKTTFDSSLFPDNKARAYLLPLKKSVRFAEGIDAGDTVKVTCTLL